jgi:hypothetical protein
VSCDQYAQGRGGTVSGFAEIVVAGVRTRSGDSPDEGLARLCRAPRLEPQHGPPWLDRPAWRFVPAGDTLQIDTVFLEVQVLFMPP